MIFCYEIKLNTLCLRLWMQLMIFQLNDCAFICWATAVLTKLNTLNTHTLLFFKSRTVSSTIEKYILCIYVLMFNWIYKSENCIETYIQRNIIQHICTENRVIEISRLTVLYFAIVVFVCFGFVSEKRRKIERETIRGLSYSTNNRRERFV